MGPRLKKTRNRLKESESQTLEWLSLLPDSILTHIFSFLDTKTAIRTSVLAKRYKQLWALSRRLDFVFPNGFHIPPSGDNSQAKCFMSYVNRVLQQREHSDLILFKLSLHDATSPRFVEDCIYYAAKHKVQNFKLRYFDKDKPIALPKLLITSTSLISLNLNAAVSKSIELPRSVRLPNLKELRLKGFEFSSRNFHGELFNGSPSLETLVLKKCCIKPVTELKALDVNFPKLVSLEIINWRSPWRCFDEHVIVVNAPKLAFFKLRGFIVRFDFVGKFSCLNEVCIMLSYPSAWTTTEVGRYRKSAEACIGLIRQLRSARSLSLSLKAAKIISSLPQIHFYMDFILENVKNVKIIVENEYMESNVPINDVVDDRFVSVSTDCTFYASEAPKLSLERKSKSKKKHAKRVIIRLRALQFLIEISPSATLFTIELPKESSSD